MGEYKEVEGDLISLAVSGQFDVIAHGCNCFCTMGAGIAVEMAKVFSCNTFRFEEAKYRGNILKLGQIDYEPKMVLDNEAFTVLSGQIPNLYVVNAYTQFGLGKDDEGNIPLDYNALALCFKKLNHLFKGKRIGLPQIGCGLAGGSWDDVKGLIQKYLTDVDVTVVIYTPPKN